MNKRKLSVWSLNEETSQNQRTANVLLCHKRSTSNV